MGSQHTTVHATLATALWHRRLNNIDQQTSCMSLLLRDYRSTGQTDGRTDGQTQYRYIDAHRHEEGSVNNSDYCIKRGARSSANMK